MEGANLDIASVDLASTLVIYENSCTVTSSYPMECSKLIESIESTELIGCVEITELTELIESEIA